MTERLRPPTTPSPIARPGEEGAENVVAHDSGDALQRLLEEQCRLGPAEAGVVLRWSDGEEEPKVLALVPAAATRDRDSRWLSQAVSLIGRVPRPQPALPSPQAVHAKSGWSYARLDEGALYDPRGTAYLMARSLPGEPADHPSAAAAFVVRASQGDLAIIGERLSLVWSVAEFQELKLAFTQRSQATEQTALVLECAGTLAEQTRFRGMATALCDTLASKLRCERVSLGLLQGRSLRLRGMSHTEKLVRGAQAVQDIELAMEECFDQDVEVWAPADMSTRFINRAARDLSVQGQHRSVLSVPLRTPRTTEDAPLLHIPGFSPDPEVGPALWVRGVVTLERDSSKPFSTAEIEAIRTLLDLVAPRLWATWESDRWIGLRAARSARRGLAVLLGPRHTWLKLAALALLAGAIFLIVARGTYRVEASFRVEAVRRQVVPAPFDSFLREVLVRVGDEVQQAQVLARLDDTQLRLQLAEAAGELATHQKEASVARDQGKTAEEQIALAQTRRVTARMKLLEHQIGQTLLLAPIAGVVVTGDLEKMMGAPVQTGQSLFELAPLDALRAELSVGEDQIGDVTLGQAGRLATAALPSARMPFTVERIDPVAEVVEQRNVFKVRVQLQERPAWLRPGMEGVAKIDVDRRRYAWIWTRRLVNWVRMKLWV